MNAPALEFDWIVVGAGTAGCLLANRLSAEPQARVLLIEAGGPDRYAWIHIPVGYLYCIGNPRTDWCYQTEPAPGLNGRVLRYPRGRVLGGCSSINGMIYMRGQQRDWDGWAAATGEPGWRWEAVLPLMRRHEDHWRGESAFHGSGGGLRVEKQRLRWAVLEAFAAAAQQAGIPATEDFNTGNNEGVGYFEVNQRRGVRVNAARAFLHPVRQRPNLVVWTDTVAEQLLWLDDARAGGAEHEGGAAGAPASPTEAGRADAAPAQHCSGLQVLRGGQRLRLRARRGVVLAAGAIGSPLLLERSGVGRPALLQAAGVRPRHHLPGVGAQLQDHLQIRAVYGVANTPTLNTRSARWWGKAAIAAEYALRRSGPMSMAPSQLGAFTRSGPEQAWPNLQYHVQPLSLPAFGEPLDAFNAFTASVCNLNPSSRGSSHLRSADPTVAPAIAPNHLSTDEDRRIAAESLRLTRRIVAQPALAHCAPVELKPGPEHQSDADLARLAGDIGTTIFHPVGTCAMGPADDPQAVVTPRLAVRGVAGLWVVDASVMPTITSGNTNAPTLAIAERWADWMAAGR